MSAASPLAPPPAWTAQLQALRGRWRGLPQRERRLAGLAAVVLGAFVLWAVAIQPAVQVLRTAPAQRDALERQLQEMRLLAAEAQQLRATPVLGADQAGAALRAASERLGGQARLTLQGDRAVLTLNGVGSAPLREWLAAARAGARARPVEAQLTRGAQGFSGTIVLSLGGGA